MAILWSLVREQPFRSCQISIYDWLMRTGLTMLGMIIGVLVIVWAWVVIWIYVRWANRDYDASVARLRGSL